jgi:hypothetical protein
VWDRVLVIGKPTAVLPVHELEVWELLWYFIKYSESSIFWKSWDFVVCVFYKEYKYVNYTLKVLRIVLLHRFAIWNVYSCMWLREHKLPEIIVTLHDYLHGYHHLQKRNMLLYTFAVHCYTKWWLGLVP